MTPVKQQVFGHVRPSQVRVNIQTWDQVQGQVRYQVNNQVEDQVRDLVQDQFKSKMQ